MKNLILISACTMLFLSCKDGTGSATESATGATSGSTPGGEEYFSYLLDGKEMSIPAADISTSYYPSDSSFHVFAGKDQQTSIVLTVPGMNRCPCTVPAGSAAPGNILSQGSVSLQNYPKRPTSFNSWYLTMHETPPAEAIKITDVGTPKEGYRYITGTFHAKVLKTETNGNSPDNVDHDITNGKFRVKHSLEGREAF